MLPEAEVEFVNDFKPLDEDELALQKAEIIVVVDMSDRNWWRGKTQCGCCNQNSCLYSWGAYFVWVPIIPILRYMISIQ